MSPTLREQPKWPTQHSPTSSKSTPTRKKIYAQNSVTLADGSYLIVWREDINASTGPGGDDYALRAQIFNADQTPRGEAFTIAAPEEGVSLAFPMLAANTDGGFSVTFPSQYVENEENLVAAEAWTFDANGTFLGQSELDGTIDHYAAYQSTSLADGTVLSLWSDYSETGESMIFGQRIDANGQKVGTKMRLDNNDEDGGGRFASFDAVQQADGSIVVITADLARGNVPSISLFDIDGTRLGTSNTVFELGAGEENGRGSTMDVVALAHGGFAVLYTIGMPGNAPQDNDVRVRAFNADGTPMTGEYTIDIEQGTLSGALTALPSGGFSLSAVARASDGSDDVWLQEFGVHSSGILLPHTAVRLADLATTNQFTRVDAVTLDDGSVVTSWETDSFVDGEHEFSIASQTVTFSDHQVWQGTDIDNVMAAGAGHDSLFGHGGNDVLLGETGNDEVFGGDGDDLLDGGGGADDLRAGSQDDQLFGGRGADSLRGNRGDDTLDGGNGADVLNGGRGSDVMTGGDGADVFVFTGANRGFDVITDFEDGVDLIDLAGGLSAGDVTVIDTADGALLVADGTALHLLGTDAADIGAADFI